MNTRRRFIGTMAAGVLGLAAVTARAAQPTVEIIAMVHPPVQDALKPLRSWLASQGAKLRVIEIDAESAQGEKRLGSIGLKGHIPITILVEGKYRHQRKDGGTVDFVNFPSANGSPPGITGNWTTADVEEVVSGRIR